MFLISTDMMFDQENCGTSLLYQAHCLKQKSKDLIAVLFDCPCSCNTTLL